MLSFRIDDADTAEAQRWAERLGVDRSELQRDARDRPHKNDGSQPGWWHLQLDTDATLTVTSPTGRTRVTRPPGTLWPLVA
jgi:hypothetical protein